MLYIYYNGLIAYLFVSNKKKNVHSLPSSQEFADRVPILFPLFIENVLYKLICSIRFAITSFTCRKMMCINIFVLSFPNTRRSSQIVYYEKHIPI